MKDLIINKSDLIEGRTVKLLKGQIVRVNDWKSKTGDNILFTTPIAGIYKLHGKLKDYDENGNVLQE
jgi:hypothetical protein